MNQKVFFVVTVDWYFASHRLHLGKELVRKNFDVYLLSHFGEAKTIIEQQGINTLELYTPQSKISPTDLFNLGKLMKLIIQFQPDIVHSIALKPVLLSALISPLFPKTKFVHAVSGLGSSFSYQGRDVWKAQIKLMLLKLILLAKNNTIIVQNQSDQQILSKYIEPNRVHLIRGSGVDAEQFTIPLQPVRISELPSIKILLPCRLIWEKGIKYYAEAAKLLTHQCSRNFQFDIAGRLYPANKFSLSEDDIKTLEQEYPVRWLGHLRDMHKHYHNYQIVCLPTYYNEGLPRVLIEASSCGIPCITTNRPGCNDIIIDNYNGKIVPIKNAQAIATAIQEIVADDDFYLQLSRNARNRVKESFSSEVINQATISVYYS